MIKPKLPLLPLVLACPVLALANPAMAHPHVFIETTVGIERNDKNEVYAVEYQWKFDELFSASIQLDFDDDGDGTISDEELHTVQKTILENIAEFDFFTAVRSKGEVIGIGTPKVAKATLDKDNILHLALTVPLEKPVPTNDSSFKLSVSDESFYVAFDYAEPDVTIKGGTNSCTDKITVPDFDALNAKNPDAYTEAFSEDPDKPDYADEYYTWITVTCPAS